jgi:PAS domain S-box-containing protein
VKNQKRISNSIEVFLTKNENINLLLGNTLTIIYKYNFSSQSYEYFSPSIKTLTGYTIDDINKIGFNSFVQRMIEVKKELHKVKTSNAVNAYAENFSAKYEIITKAGELKWVEDNAFIKFDEKGIKQHSIGILKDVTPIYTFFNSCDEERKRLEKMLNLSSEIFLAFSNNFEVKFINKKGCEIFGYESNQMIGRNWFNFVSPNYKEAAEKILLKISGNPAEKQEVIEYPVINSEGDQKIIQWRVSNLFDEDGKSIMIINSGSDITKKIKEQKVQEVIASILQAANTLQNIDEFFSFVHSSIKLLMPAENFYIALYDKESGCITFPYFVDVVDKEAPPKRFGKGLTEYVLTTGKSALITREKDHELVMSGEVELMGTPSAIWLGVPLKIRDNTVGVLVVQDYETSVNYGEREKEILETISHPLSSAIERKIEEYKRVMLIEELKELNLSKDRLFSLISHDLRSPFNSLLGFAEILSSEHDTLTSEEVKEYLNMIYESSKNLYSMTNNLLQFSRFQMGKLEYHPEKLNLSTIVHNNVKMVQGNAVKKQLAISMEVEPDFDVLADEDMVNSIIQNLVSNSIKFTPKGGKIKVIAKKLKKPDETNFIEICVEDTGIGMTSMEMDKIIQDHLTSKPGTEKEYGTGLGLLLVKEFVNKNGGKIFIQSTPKKGTKFSFTLPIFSE